MTIFTNGVLVQDVQHLLGQEDHDKILTLLGYRLVPDHEQLFGRVIAKCYPFWAGSSRWARSRHELWLKDTRWMLSRARAEPLTIRVDGISWRSSRLATNKYRRPGDLRSVSFKYCNLYKTCICGRCKNGGSWPRSGRSPRSRGAPGAPVVQWGAGAVGCRCLVQCVPRECRGAVLVLCLVQ